MSARRQVPSPEMMTIQNMRTYAFPIACGPCRIKDGMPAKRFPGGIPFEPYRKYFFHKGWDVHYGDPMKDKCPNCVKLEEEARRQRRIAHQSQHHQVPDVSKPGATQPPTFYQFGPTYPELKELQARFTTKRDPDDIRREIRLLEQRLSRLRLQVLGFDDVPTPTSPQPLRVPSRPPLSFWSEGFGVEAVNS